jgi:hypothetical protein
MGLSCLILTTLLSCLSHSLAANSTLSYDVFPYVDLLIGSSNGGELESVLLFAVLFIFKIDLADRPV